MANKEDKFFEDDLFTTEYLGEIVDVNDSEYMGRCKIRVFGKFDHLSNEDLPFAFPILSNSFSGSDGSGRFSTPKKGNIVKVKFNNGNLYSPEYYAIQNLNPELQAELKKSYVNAHGLIWDNDENLKIYYTQAQGMIFTLKDSIINIKPDSSITIEHKDTKSIIELKGPNITITADAKIDISAQNQINENSNEINVTGLKTTLGPQPIFSNLSAEPMWQFLTALSTAVDAKWPVSPGVMAGLAATAQQASTSKTVKTSP